MTATEQFINVLTNLKPGELGLLRTHAGQGLDESVHGFDLFAGIWWPLRQESQRAPRRGVAWLIAKLYASCPIPQSGGQTLARELRRCEPREERARKRFRQKFDELLTLPLRRIEPALRWALDLIASKQAKLDWVKLTDDLSIWERETTRRRWANEYLQTDERSDSC
ncbi:MAG: type I-E CRISPR-associated protein Cse2/CasB [Candidatus Zixiibacteriota bacterium]